MRAADMTWMVLERVSERSVVAASGRRRTIRTDMSHTHTLLQALMIETCKQCASSPLRYKYSYQLDDEAWTSEG